MTTIWVSDVDEQSARSYLTARGVPEQDHNRVLALAGGRIKLLEVCADQLEQKVPFDGALLRSTHITCSGRCATWCCTSGADLAGRVSLLFWQRWNRRT